MQMKNRLIALVMSTFLLLSPALAVPFQLHNSSLRSIPLRIPGVMNPNLSPLSDSGVDLRVGQEVFFYWKKKRYLLFVVSEELEGQVLDVPRLIRQRKQELNLK